MHCFGTGHSRIPVEEMFPRYGSYPGFNPIVELSMTFHTQVVGANGQRQAMFIERVEGLAATILANFRLRPTDALMVFSAGGDDRRPDRDRRSSRARHGLAVIAVTSLEHSRASASEHSSGTRLADHADVVLDLCTPVGRRPRRRRRRARRPGLDGRRRRARERGQGADRGAARSSAAQLPPVLTAAALVGADESRRLFDAAYAEHARRYTDVLRTD